MQLFAMLKSLVSLPACKREFMGAECNVYATKKLSTLLGLDGMCTQLCMQLCMEVLLLHCVPSIYCVQQNCTLYNACTCERHKQYGPSRCGRELTIRAGIP